VHRPGLMRRHADRLLPIHELIVVQAGMLPIAEEDRRFEVRRGEWVLLRAGRRHFGYDDLDGKTWFYWVCFGDSTDAEVDDAIVSERRTGTVSRPGRVRAHFEHLLEDQHRAILSPTIARSHLQLLLAEMRLPPIPEARDEAAPGLAGARIGLRRGASERAGPEHRLRRERPGLQSRLPGTRLSSVVQRDADGPHPPAAH
jgi:hypothetical protein